MSQASELFGGSLPRILLALFVLLVGLGSGLVASALVRRYVHRGRAQESQSWIERRAGPFVLLIFALIGVALCMWLIAPILPVSAVLAAFNTELETVARTVRLNIAHEDLISAIQGVGLTLLVTVSLIVLFRVVQAMFRTLNSQMESWAATRLRPLKVQEMELLSERTILHGLRRLLRVARIVAIIMLVYIYILAVFSFFPATRSLASALLEDILTPLRTAWQAFLGYVPNIFYIAIIGLITYYGLRFIRLLFDAIERSDITFSGFHPDWAKPTYQIVRVFVLALAAITIFPYLPGSSSPAFQAVSVFLGILISLGSSSAVANVISGIVLTYMRSFAVGDRVTIAGYSGDVIEKSLLVTRIRTIKNEDITIPNAQVLGSAITNFSSNLDTHPLILHTSVTIGYDVPWRQVHDLLMAAAQATDQILASPPPFVLQTSLDDFYVSYQINAYTNLPAQMAAIYSELHQNIQDKFNDANVEIMSPHYSALREGQKTTIPDDYLPTDYEPSPFRVVQMTNLRNGKARHQTRSRKP